MINKHSEYWHQNIKILSILISIWFIFGFIAPILAVDYLNQFRLGGFKLGFWFAQQGSIYVFIILICTYVHLMNKIDKKYNVEEK